jgi:hypothetical protein
VIFPPQSVDKGLSNVQQHEMLKDTIGGNYFGPVRELLTVDPERRKHVGKSLFIMRDEPDNNSSHHSRLGLW